MAVHVIALSIPAFIGLIGVEYAVARWRGHRVYRLHDTLSDLGCGVSSQLVGLLYSGAVFAVYVALYDGRPLDLPTWAQWVVGLLGVDLAYYAWHRASHRINFLWAAHVVHHQSEDYNLAVALRQAWFTGLSSWLVNLPLALLGVPPTVYAISASINLLYQFWIHTREIGTLGPLEWVLNTASHHRVHHGVNAPYIDKNYGGILIVWDRLFGTFAPEREPVVYGTVEPFRSWNPVWANFEKWAALWRMARAAPTRREAVWTWLAPPEWAPSGRSPHAPLTAQQLAARVQHETQVPAAVDLYAAIQFAPAIAATAAVLWFEHTAPASALGAAALLTVLTVASVGALFDDRPWARGLEVVRLALIAAACASALPSTPWAAAGLVFVAASSLALARLPRAARATAAG